MQERLLHGARIMSGENHLDRPVRWCHPLLDVLGEQGVDMSTTVALADEAELDSRRWSALLKSGCAAVFLRGSDVVKTPTVREDGPAIVWIPASVRRRSLVELVATLGLAHQTYVLQYGQRVHASLAQLLHRGAGLTALCSRLARMSECSVAVLDNDLHLLAFDPGPARLDPHAVSIAVKASRRQLLGATRSDPHRVAVLELGVRSQRHACVVGAIDLVEQREGWVVLIDPTAAPTEHDLAEHRVAVEQAVTIVGTELLRIRGLERAEERARGNFVHALLHGRFTNHADLVARASHHAFDADARYGVVVAHSGGLIAHGDSPTKLADMAREAAHLLETGGQETLTAVVGDVIAVIRRVSAAHRGQPDPAAEELRDYASSLARRLSERSHRFVLVAYGRPTTGAATIMESYREARIALDLRQRLNVTEVCGFADLRVDSVLLELAQEDAGRDFSAEILEPLRNERDGSLVEVARAYVQAGGNLNEAARRLSVHRNTMLYKLDRITRLLQRDIRDPDMQFGVWLAIRLTDLAETTRRVNRDLSSG